MLRSNPNVQNSYEFVCLEELVPQHHLLRKIHKHIDFSFILEKVKPYYCENNGRSSVDPIMLFKMMFIGYLYGIRSERQLEQEDSTQRGLSLVCRIGFDGSRSGPQHLELESQAASG